MVERKARSAPGSHLHNRVYRANPAYRLVTLDQLATQHQDILDHVRGEPGADGALLPQDQFSLPVKVVDRDTAELFIALREPGRLPPIVEAEALPEILDLVLENVLQIERDGAFLSLADAQSLISRNDNLTWGTHRLVQLSVDAVRYAGALPTGDPQELAMRLYAFNRLPLTPALRRQFPSPQAVNAFTGLQPDGHLLRRMERWWVLTSTAARDSGWTTLSRRGAHPHPAGQPMAKVYLSPVPEAMADALQASVDLLAAHRCSAFKVGNTVGGILRPDKIVAYFQNRDLAQAAAGAVARHLAGLPAQGVPFTAPIDPAGLVSWGVDPPQTPGRTARSGPGSWRQWQTQHLASNLIAAQSSQGSLLASWQFALHRLRSAGVDLETWSPTAQWDAAIGAGGMD